MDHLDPDTLIGYADDLTDVISDTDPIQLHARGQLHINAIFNWCTSVGLTINTDKSKAILFTSSRNISLPPLTIGTSNIPYVTSTKIMGITIDAKLNFRDHIDNTLKTSLSKFHIFSRFVGKKWGLSPAKSKWAYETTLRPSAAYGALIWGHSLAVNANKKKALKMEANTLRHVTRAFKSTPPHILYTITNITPLEFYILKSSICDNIITLQTSSLTYIRDRPSSPAYPQLYRTV